MKKPPQNKQIAESHHWQGPLPPPGALLQFNDILDNGAERIFQMAASEQAHRIELEKLTLQANISAQNLEGSAIKRGHYLGAAVSITSIVASVTAAYLGAHWSVSVALVGVPLMSAVRAIVLRK